MVVADPKLRSASVVGPSRPGALPADPQEPPHSHAPAASAVLRNAVRSGVPGWTRDLGRPDWQPLCPSPVCCCIPGGFDCASVSRRNSDSFQLAMGQRRRGLFDNKQTPTSKGREWFSSNWKPGNLSGCKAVTSCKLGIHVSVLRAY